MKVHQAITILDDYVRQKIIFQIKYQESNRGAAISMFARDATPSLPALRHFIGGT